MDLDRVGAVFELVALAHRLARQLARLARGHKSSAQSDGHGHANHKAASLGTHDLGDAHAGKMLGQGIYHGL